MQYLLLIYDQKDALQERGELRGYYLLPAARGDLLRRMERWEESSEAYRPGVAPASRRLYAEISPAVLARRTCRQDAGATLAKNHR